MSIVRSAVRSLARAPLLGLGAVACTALGAAALASIATFVTALLVRPVPFPHADRLVRVWMEQTEGDPRADLSIPELQEVSRLPAFEAFMGTARSRMLVLLPQGARRMRGEAVTPDYFENLGIAPARGRFFAAADHRPDAPPTAVLSHASWLSLFGGEADVVGKALRTERFVYTIVGIAPPGFRGTVEEDVVELFTPLAHYEPAGIRTDRRSRQSWAIGRLGPDTALGDAAGQTAALTRAWAAAHPDLYRGHALRVEPMGENYRSEFRAGGLLLAAAAAVLLLIAALNVAGLLLARTLDRRRELAVRSALGAGRSRLAAQLMLEALLLTALGGLLGAASSRFVLAAFLKLAPVSLPPYVELRPEPLALLVALAAVAAAGVVAGVAPALAGSRVGPADALKESGRGSVRGRAEGGWGAFVVSLEVALTLVLLVAGGLLLRSWERLTFLPLGYRTEGVARLTVTLSRTDAATPEAVAALTERLASHVSGHPGVERVGLVSPTLPPWDAYRPMVTFAALAAARPEHGLEVGGHIVDPRLLPALEVPILAGRNIEPLDRQGSEPVAVVSRSLAERVTGGADFASAVGREIGVTSEDERDPRGSFTIVGVAGDVAYDGIGEQGTMRYIRYGEPGDARGARHDVYLALAQHPARTVSIAAVVRAEAGAGAEPAALLEPLSRRIGELAPASPVHWTSTMRNELAVEFAPSRLHAVLVTSFSASALVLTAVGLFALVSQGVARRTGEIGLRVALGALPRHILGLVFRSGATPLLAGMLAGLIASLGAARLVSRLLYGVSPFDAAAFAGASGLLAVVTLLACAWPARRAASLAPVAALREG